MAEVKVKDVQKTSQDIINGLTTKGLKALEKMEQLDQEK